MLLLSIHGQHFLSSMSVDLDVTGGTGFPKGITGSMVVEGISLAAPQAKEEKLSMQPCIHHAGYQLRPLIR